MKNNLRHALIFSFLFIALVQLPLLSQENVGINKTNPNQSLDVEGNVNVDGNIMFNGQPGQPGQILKTNGAGSSQWVDFTQFDNIQGYYISGSGTWFFPSGITKVGIELQGGGGGGSTTAGGAGGNYISFVIDVSGESAISYTVGTGGAYNATNKKGNDSSVNIAGVTYTAKGGEGAPLVERGGFNVINETGSAKYFSALGQPGTANDYNYTYGPNGNTVFKTNYGTGGGTYPFYVPTPGGTRLKNVTLNTDLNITNCTAPIAHGAGGAANITLSSANSGKGGYVRFHY